MANSKYEYVRSFEQPDILLANTWIVVRIDGRGFSKLTTKYKFVKPNDQRGVDLMNAAAEAVMRELPDLVLAYGNSDEYSFVFHKDCMLFERRASKLTTTIVSTFTSHYMYLWSVHFPEQPLTPPLPSFDGRAVCYPSDANLRDYMSWRQVDCHINNLYNTTFWTLVQKGGMGAQEAEQKLSGTVSADKNEILFKEFSINYNNEPECFKKGTVLYRDFFEPKNVEKPTLPDLASFPSPPLAHPQPIRVSARPSSQPIEDRVACSEEQMVLPNSPGFGPTFLSTTSTPSPPPVLSAMMSSALPNPLRSNPVSTRTSTFPPSSAMPISPPSTVTSPYGSLFSPPPNKPFHPTLTPLPLSPLTLKPSTKPPQSLGAPNPTTRENFSPVTPSKDFPADFPVAGYSHRYTTKNNRPPSHSASASLTMAGPSQSAPARTLKHRSPSQPHLPTYFGAGSSPPGPPAIPLRISSIPANSKPRKLSLPLHRSTSTLKQDRLYSKEKESSVSPNISGSNTPRRVSPPLRTDKELPSPPLTQEEELRTREKVKASSPKGSSPGSSSFPSSGRRASDSENRQGRVWADRDINHPGIAELPATTTTKATRVRSHSRLHSAPVSSSLYQPYQSPDVQALAAAAAASATSASKSQQPFSNTYSLLSTEIPSGKFDDVISPLHAPVASTKPEKSALGSVANPLPRSTSPSNPPAQLTSHPVTTNTKNPNPKPDTSFKPDPNPTTAPLTGKAKNRAKNQHKSSSSGGGRGQRDEGTNARPTQTSKTQREKDRKKRAKARIVCEHVDLIKDAFWEARPWILSGRTTG